MQICRDEMKRNGTKSVKSSENDKSWARGREEKIERERMIERSAKELVRDGSREKLNNFGFDVFLGETGKGFRSL